MASPLITHFNGGEVSPLLAGRHDLSGASSIVNACRSMQNMLGIAQGPAVRIPGTLYEANAADQDDPGRLVPFVFSTVQAYMLDLGAGALRFFTAGGGQVTVADTTAAITNGGFDSGITGWTDQSAGAAAIAHGYIGADEEGTWDAANNSNQIFGDGQANGRNLGLKFANTAAGDVTSVTIYVEGVSSAFNAVAAIYTDSSGSPGTQVGGNSDAVSLNATGAHVFTWSSNDPTLSASTDYWVVLTDTSGASGSVTVRQASDQGSAFASGRHDTITSIADGSGSTSREWKVRILVRPSSADGVLELQATGSDAAIAEQSLTVPTAAEQVLAFRVRGVAGDTVTVRIGTASGGEDVFADFEAATGWHVIAFTSAAVATVYLQFEAAGGKTVSIDDVAFLDDQPLELTMPWDAAALADRRLKWVQSADVMYFTHPEFSPYRLSRYGASWWSVEAVLFEDGPWLDENTDTGRTLDPAATTGVGISVTASGFAPFRATDVGRLLRFGYSSNYGWAVITGFVSTTEVTVDIKRDLSAHTAVSTWRFGLYGDRPGETLDDKVEAAGWPAACVFHEERFALGGAPDRPSRLDMSQSLFDIENFTPDKPTDGSVEDDDAIGRTIASNQVSTIRWLASGDKLFAGTSGAVYRAERASETKAIAPDNFEVRSAVREGVADVAPLVVADNIVLYLDETAKSVQELVFDIAKEGYVAPDMLLRAEHLTSARTIDELAWQRRPHRTVWAQRDDGTLIAMAYMRDEGVVSWCRRPMAATGSAASVVEAIATIPGSGADELWLKVRRTVDGNTVRHIERLAPFPDNGTDSEDMVWYDGAVSYSGSATATLSGLGHLEGETVHIAGIDTADSAYKYLGSATVSGGSVTIPDSKQTTRAHVGLGTATELRPVRRNFVAGGGEHAGDAVLRTRQVFALRALLDRSGSYMVGDGTRSVERVHASLFSGVDGEDDDDFPGDWTSEADIDISQDATQPWPLTVVALQPMIGGGSE